MKSRFDPIWFLEWFNETEEVDDFLQSHFLMLLKPLSLLTDISWSMGETISPETIAIGEYVKGNLNNSDYADWSEKFDMLQYIKNAIANSRNQQFSVNAVKSP